MEVSDKMTRVNKAEAKAYDYIKNQIVTGSWPPLTKVIEQDISDFLNISRSPVRSAIKHLSDEGLLDAEPYKGAIVARRSLTQQEFVDRMEMFEMLLQQYTFLLEKRHLHLDEANLMEYLHDIDEAVHHKESMITISYMSSQLLKALLVEQPNQYIRQTIISISEDVLNIDHIKERKTMYPIYQIFIDGIRKMINDMSCEKYDSARKDIRLFVNRLMLQVIEEQQVS